MRILGDKEVVPQPKNPFSWGEYVDALKQYQRIKQDIKIMEKGSKNFHWEQRWKSLDEYHDRLPVYLLARCPFCSGKVWEQIDTLSLNGLGWGPPKTGFGWFGLSKDSGPGLQTDCNHFRLVAVGVNLNCLVPDDVYETIEIGSERPFVMTPLMNIANSFAVLRTLPVGRFDTRYSKPHYTAWFVSYFTDTKETFDSVMKAAYETYSLVHYSVADYDLRQWVEAGKLLWIDVHNPDLPLQSRQEANFPYADFLGNEGANIIYNGKLESRYGGEGKHRCPGTEKKGVIKILLDFFSS